ncbi:MTPAP family protein [Megaselia abdita]
MFKKIKKSVSTNQIFSYTRSCLPSIAAIKKYQLFGERSSNIKSNFSSFLNFSGRLSINQQQARYSSNFASRSEFVAGSNVTKFQDFMNERQFQARSSVLIQVGSEHSFPELFNYCLKFGEILVCKHYQTKNGHFILLQFSNESYANELLDSSSSNESSLSTTVRSPYLWFKTGKKPKIINSAQYGKGVLSSKFGNSVITEDLLNSEIRNAISIEDQMGIIVSKTQLSDLSIRLRYLAAHQIEKTFKEIIPSCKAYPFGSSVNGFGKMGCDLDMILKIDNKQADTSSRLVFQVKEHFNNERTQKQRQMEAIGNILQIFLPGVENVRRILQARVPIIKYHHDFLNLEVDLSMNDLSGLHMSELFYSFGNIDIRVRAIIFTIRRWAQIIGLTNPSPGRWITNFSLSSLVIHFLQQLDNPLLPPINNFKNYEDSREDKEIKQFELSKTQFLTNNNIKLEELLLQFFEYYSSFDFSNRAISMVDGNTVNKPDHSAMYIINPFDKTHNVSKNVSFEECERFKIEVRNAAWILETELENNVNLTKNGNWGLLNLFKTNNIVKPNVFYKPRMVDVSELFCKNVK